MALSLNREILDRPSPEDLAHVQGGITSRKTTRKTIQLSDGSYSEIDVLDEFDAV